MLCYVWLLYHYSIQLYGIDKFCSSGSSCIICLSRPKTCKLTPCEHLSLCEGCADRLLELEGVCPICKVQCRSWDTYVKLDANVSKLDPPVDESDESASDQSMMETDESSCLDISESDLPNLQANEARYCEVYHNFIFRYTGSRVTSTVTETPPLWFT